MLTRHCMAVRSKRACGIQMHDVRRVDEELMSTMFVEYSAVRREFIAMTRRRSANNACCSCLYTSFPASTHRCPI